VECGEVGVGELGIGDFEMFPNPTNGQLFIRLPEEVRSTLDLRVMDLTGRVVFQGPISPVQHTTTVLDLGMLANGNYVVTLNGGDWVRTKQLQITR
ncbi:MAG TPA: T9SS type A sorting domain-containing protein, partial [Flavobacteriales bacterium]